VPCQPTTCNGQIGDFVWYDANGNGCQDAGEPGIAGVQVDLYHGTCASPGSRIATTTTDSSGHYLFTGLCAGDYQVAITTPAGYTATTPNKGCKDTTQPSYTADRNSKCNCGGGSPCITCVTLTAANPVNLNVDCGYVTPPSANCVTIIAVQGVPITPVTMVGSGGCGGYKFSATGLPSNLTMSQSGTISGTPTASGTFNYTVTLIDSCGNTGTVNCSVTVTCNGQIGDFVWYDVNGNGCQDAGEPGIPGVQVSLYSGACGSSGTLIATTTTDNTGHYLFSGLCAGTYQVAISAPSGYTATTPKKGCKDNTQPPYTADRDSKCNCGGASPCITCVTLTAANPVNLNVDCGYVCNGQIGDFVWNDVNGNGCQDAGEPGIPGVQVSLYSGACGSVGTLIATTTTDSSGHYLFSGLCAGTYQVAITTPAGGTVTTPNIGCKDATQPPYTSDRDSKCSCGGASPCFVCVTLTAPNLVNLNVDCGYILPCPPCAPHDIQYNFNGTQIIFQPTAGGSYVWFISDGKVSGLPSNKKVVLHISGQMITIPATGSSPQYLIPVPDAFITFDPSATLATTTFDTVNNVWRMTYPPSGMSGNIFYGGAAFKVPAAGLPGGIKNVDWNGSFTTDTAGLTVNWQWSAANYSNFTSAYNAIAPKPTDDNQKSVYKNSDHAGTPEGTDPGSGKLWQTFVVGGASGGGGGNYTGSGSSTISFPPCVCPTP
jgi:hypothetical protein